MNRNDVVTILGEKVDWDKPIELMDGSDPDGFLLNTLRLFCDCHGCVGAGEVRTAPLPVVGAILESI